MNTYASRIKDICPCAERCNVRYVVIATHSGVANAITALLTVTPLKRHMQKGHNKVLTVSAILTLGLQLTRKGVSVGVGDQSSDMEKN